MAATALAATSSPAAVLGGARLPPAPRATSFLLPLSMAPHRRALPSVAFSFPPSSHFSGRFSSRRVRALSSSEETSSSVQADDLLADLKEKWDSIDNKSTVFLYGGGAILAVWLSSIVVGAINSVPLLPKLMELVGLGYTGWFVYRYLLFKATILWMINQFLLHAKFYVK